MIVFFKGPSREGGALVSVFLFKSRDVFQKHVLSLLELFVCEELTELLEVSKILLCSFEQFLSFFICHRTLFLGVKHVIYLFHDAKINIIFGLCK